MTGTLEQEHLLREYDMLRAELHMLKQCQIKYFWGSVVATSAILGLGSKLGGQLELDLLVFVAPLVVVLPCWFIFYDKATTITRIVGYVRLLERQLDGRVSSRHHVGWENALRLYRESHDRSWPGGSLGEKVRQWPSHALRGLGHWLWDAVRGLWTLITPMGTQRYWTMNFFTYASLGGICVTLGLHSLPGSRFPFLWWIAAGVYAFAVVHNLHMLRVLTRGEQSYSACESAWQELPWETAVEATSAAV